MNTNQINIICLTPQRGAWLTQATLQNAEQRIFSDSVYCKQSDTDNWVEWTEAERTQWLTEHHDSTEEQQTDTSLSPDMILKRAKATALDEAERYYNSDNVCSFTYQGVPLWTDFENRSKLRMRLEAEHLSSMTQTVIWYGGRRFELPITAAQQMLTAVELYASKCYDTYQQHRLNIAALQTEAEVRAYDYTTSYPTKLSF